MTWYTGDPLYDTLLVVGFAYAALVLVGSLFGTAAYGGRFGGGKRAKALHLHRSSRRPRRDGAGEIASCRPLDPSVRRTGLNCAARCRRVGLSGPCCRGQWCLL